MNILTEVIDFDMQYPLKNRTYLKLYKHLIKKGYTPRILHEMETDDPRYVCCSDFVLTSYDNMCHLLYRVTDDGSMISEVNANSIAHCETVEELLYD